MQNYKRDWIGHYQSKVASHWYVKFTPNKSQKHFFQSNDITERKDVPEEETPEVSEAKLPKHNKKKVEVKKAKETKEKIKTERVRVETTTVTQEEGVPLEHPEET